MKFVDGNMVVNASISVDIKTCLSFDFTNSILKILESESSSGPILKKIYFKLLLDGNLIF